MLTMICAVILGLIVYSATDPIPGFHPVWSIVCGFAAMTVFQILVSLVLRRKSLKITQMIQQTMMETQAKIQARQNQFMRKPTSQKIMLATLEKEQNEGIEKILDILNLYKPLYLWNFMLKKQVNTMRMMFLYQQKKFDQVDELMPQCVFFDSQSIAMKMARLYEKKEFTQIDRFFKKKARRLRKPDDAVLPYSLYAWILVKQERYDDAISTLNNAKQKTSNEVIAKNWEMLVNKKYKHFSNAQLGDAWYALALENPKLPKMQQ